MSVEEKTYQFALIADGKTLAYYTGTLLNASKSAKWYANKVKAKINLVDQYGHHRVSVAPDDD